MSTKQTIGMFSAMLGMCLVFSAIVILFSGSQPVLGSTLQGNDYVATSTAGSTQFGGFTGGRVLSSRPGSLGQVTITGANTGIVNFYDATTTDVTKRTNNYATSTILVASFPASTAAGTYTFDAQLKTGLYIDLVSGVMPTSTVMYR